MHGLLSVLRPHRRATVAITLASVLAAAVEAGVLAIIAAAAAALAASHHHLSASVLGWTLSVRAALLLALVAMASDLLLRVYITIASARVCGRTLEHARDSLLEAYIFGSWETVAGEQEGDLQTLLVANSTTLAQSTLAAVRGLTSLASLGVLVVASLVVSPVVSLVVIVVVGGALAAFLPFNARSLRSGKRLSTANVALGRYLAQLQSNILEVQGLGVGGRVASDGRRLVSDVVRPFEEQNAYLNLAPVLFQILLLFVMVTGLLAFEAWGGVSIAALAAVVLMLLRASVFGQQAQTSLQQVAQSVDQVEVMADMQSRLATVNEPARLITGPLDTVDRIRGIELSYSHPDGSRVLEGVSFEIRAGAALGIIGPSGVGKTTLLRLVLKLATPSAGRIVVNEGLDLTEIAVDSWRRLVSFVPQTPQMFAGSVAENVRYFRPWVTDEEIAEACRRAELADQAGVSIDPDRRIEGHGGKLSGGQRQRIAIARALVASPKILLLDEPTSALDQHTEEAIRDTLAALKAQGTGLVIVAHRPGLLSICDQVLDLAERRGLADSRGDAK
jgi:ABC-type multidrug transport system fused ATPase/permease subunit